MVSPNPVTHLLPSPVLTHADAVAGGLRRRPGLALAGAQQSGRVRPEGNPPQLVTIGSAGADTDPRTRTAGPR